MVHDANGADDLAIHLSLLQARDVGRVADDERGASRLLTTSHSYGASRLEKNLVYIGVEHVGAAMDGAKTTEGLWQTAKAVNRVEEG